jgi:hypothetical protein
MIDLFTFNFISVAASYSISLYVKFRNKRLFLILESLK